jgi:hypothetical protein
MRMLCRRGEAIMLYAINSAGVSIDVFFCDDNGFPLTGKVAADFPALKWSNGNNTADTTITLSDLAAITTAHPNDNTAGGVKEREGGYYRVDLPNNIFTGSGHKVLTWAESTNKRVVCPPIDVQNVTVGNVTGNVTGTVGGVTGNVGGSVASVTGAVGSVAGNVTGSVGSVAGNVGGNVNGSVNMVVQSVVANSVTGNVAGSVGSLTVQAQTDVRTAMTNQGYTTTRATYLDNLTIMATTIWNALTNNMNTVGSIGKLIVTNLDAAISSRLSVAGYTAPDNASIGQILSKFTGMTLLAGWLRNLTRKDSPDATALGEINSGGAGGTFDPTTDSEQAIRDNQSAAVIPPQVNEDNDLVLETLIG